MQVVYQQHIRYTSLYIFFLILLRLAMVLQLVSGSFKLGAPDWSSVYAKQANLTPGNAEKLWKQLAGETQKKKKHKQKQLDFSKKWQTRPTSKLSSSLSEFGNYQAFEPPILSDWSILRQRPSSDWFLPTCPAPSIKSSILIPPGWVASGGTIVSRLHRVFFRTCWSEVW